MKARFVLIWLIASSAVRAADANSEPESLFKKDGFLAITDGSSYYVFRTNGTFISAPVGMSGRTFEGTCAWNSEPDKIAFAVHARKGWWNGPESGDHYRIVFVIHGGGKKRPENPILAPSPPIDGVYTGYFLIEELVKIPKPSK